MNKNIKETAILTGKQNAYGIAIKAIEQMRRISLTPPPLPE